MSGKNFHWKCPLCEFGVLAQDAFSKSANAFTADKFAHCKASHPKVSWKSLRPLIASTRLTRLRSGGWAPPRVPISKAFGCFAGLAPLPRKSLLPGVGLGLRSVGCASGANRPSVVQAMPSPTVSVSYVAPPLPNIRPRAESLPSRPSPTRMQRTPPRDLSSSGRATCSTVRLPFSNCRFHPTSYH